MLLGLAIALSFSQQLHAAEVIPPKPQGAYLNDYAGVLSRSTTDDLDRKLRDFETQTSNQVLVVIYKKMQSDSDINDYAIRVAQAWGVGRKDRKNGVVLFIFTQDHKMTIQVGYGLEGPLPDALAKDIIEDEIKPHFRSNDYDGGVRAGVDAIMKATKGEYKGTGRILSRWMARVGFSANSWTEHFDDPSISIIDPTKAPAPDVAPRPFAGPQIDGGSVVRLASGSGR